MRPELERLMKGMLASGSSRILALALSFALNALLARTLSQDVFGFYGVVISLMVIVTFLAQAGYQTGIVRFVAERAAHDDAMGVSDNLTAAVLVTTLGSAILMLSVYACSSLLLPDIEGNSLSTPQLIWVLLLVPAMAFNILFSEALRGAGWIGSAASLSGLGQHGGLLRVLLLFVAVTLMISFADLTLVSLLVFSVLASSVAAVVSAIMLRRLFHWRLRPAEAWVFVRRDAQVNARFLVSQFSQMLSGQFMVTIIAGSLFSGPILAVFVAAQSLRVLLTAPHTLFASAVPNLMIQAHQKNDKEGLEELLRYGSSMAFVSTLVIALPFLLLGPWVFRTIFGPGYEDAYFFFAAVAPGLVVMAFGGTAARALLLLGHEKLYLKVTLVLAVVCPPLYYFVGASFGPLGLGVMSSVVLIAQQWILVSLTQKYLGVWSHAHLAPAFYGRFVRALGAQLKRKDRAK